MCAYRISKYLSHSLYTYLYVYAYTKCLCLYLYLYVYFYSTLLIDIYWYINIESSMHIYKAINKYIYIVHIRWLKWKKNPYCFWVEAAHKQLAGVSRPLYSLSLTFWYNSAAFRPNLRPAWRVITSPPPLYLLQLSAWFLYGTYRRVDLKLSELWHVQIQPVYCSSSFCWREQEERRRLRRSCDLRELLERP